MNLFNIEQQLLAHVVTFGNEAASICLPQLTPEKFCFSRGERFGPEHSAIWIQVRNAYLKDNLSPVLSVLENYLASDQLEYLHTLPTVTTCDPQLVEQLTNLVDKGGLVYNVSRYGHALGNNIASVEQFYQTLDTIQDIDSWVNEQLNRLRSNTSIQSEGYRHVSDIADELAKEWDDIYNGRISPYVNSGMPTLKANNLFPAGEIAVIHGLSGSGKSTLVFQVLLGTGIWLYVNDQSGCVAVNSLEMTDMRLVERMAAILARVDLTNLRTGTISKPEYTRLLEQLAFVRKLPIFVDDTSFLTTTAMQYRATGLHVSENGPVVQLASDYGELFQDEDSRLTKEQRVDKVFREQFSLSRLIGASVLAISQSTVDEKVSGKSYIAGADGTRYSRGILQSADIVAELWNPEQIEKAGRQVVLGDGSTLTKSNPHLLIQKRRSGEVGAAIKFGWKPEYTTFTDLALPQSPGKEQVYVHLADAYAKMKNGAKGAW